MDNLLVVNRFQTSHQLAQHHLSLELGKAAPDLDQLAEGAPVAKFQRQVVIVDVFEYWVAEAHHVCRFNFAEQLNLLLNVPGIVMLNRFEHIVYFDRRERIFIFRDPKEVDFPKVALA